MPERPGVYVHPSAVVDEPCEIGEGTKIWHFCHVMRDAKIGKNCNFGQNVFVARGVEIGDHVKIQNNVSVYEGVTLGDYVFCGPSMVFTNVTNPYALLVGNPARQAGWMCRCATRLAEGRGRLRCAACGAAYDQQAGGLIAVTA